MVDLGSTHHHKERPKRRRKSIAREKEKESKD